MHIVRNLLAAGLNAPRSVRPEHIIRRISSAEVTSLATLYKFLSRFTARGVRSSGV